MIAITSWKDKSSASNNITISSTVTLENVQSKPSLYFAPSQSLNMIPNLVLNQFPFTLFAVFKFSGGLSSSQTNMLLSSLGNQNIQIFQSYGLDGYKISVGTRGEDPNFKIFSNNFSVDTFCLLTLSITNASNYKLNINGASSINASTVFTNLPTGTAATGQYIQPTLGMYVSEYALYKSELSPTQIQDVEGYLAWKWGINASLPSSHFYKSINGYNVNVPCFKEDSKILCYKDNKEKYIKIQDIRKGDLVKTSMNGYIPVCMIGTTKLYNYNSGNNLKSPNKLFKCSMNKYPELFEDLYITGYHSILVNNITESEKEKIIDFIGQVYVTDEKYRLMAYIDEKTEAYDIEGVFNIWHLALESDDYYNNYGIYANGLLVESSSKRYMKEKSGMVFLE